jgi:hypothetical protein
VVSTSDFGPQTWNPCTTTQVGNYGVAKRMLETLLKTCPPALQPAFQSQLATCLDHHGTDAALPLAEAPGAEAAPLVLCAASLRAVPPVSPAVRCAACAVHFAMAAAAACTHCGGALGEV